MAGGREEFGLGSGRRLGAIARGPQLCGAFGYLALETFGSAHTFGDIGVRAGDPKCRAASLAQGDAAGHDPAPTPVLMAQPELHTIFGGVSRQIIVDA